MNFQKERRPEAKSAGGLAGSSGPAAEAISQFYADLVQTSGVRWADGTAAQAPGAQAAGVQAPPAAAADLEGTRALEAPLSTDAPPEGDALPQHAMDRATVTEAGVVILRPRPRAGTGAGARTGTAPAGAAHTDAAGAAAAAAAAGPVGDGHEPAELARPGPTHYGISRRNIGYQLLQKAGWSEGAGLGAQEQGRREPLAPAAVRGQVGLGFQPVAPTGRRRQGTVAAAAAQQQQQQQQQRGGEEGQAPSQQHQQSQTQRPKRPLPPDPLEKEDKDTKVKRVKQVLQAEADERAGKAIQRYIYSAFKDATGEPTSDRNPLLRPGRSKLSATNPLL